MEPRGGRRIPLRHGLPGRGHEGRRGARGDQRQLIPGRGLGWRDGPGRQVALPRDPAGGVAPAVRADGPLPGASVGQAARRGGGMSMRWSATIAARNLVEWLAGDPRPGEVERYVRQRLRDAYDAGYADALRSSARTSEPR